jgi:uncharacterized protein Yka (UPF0111/DUF47 family)
MPAMGFTLIPREMKFYDMFDQMAATLTRAGVKFHDMVITFNDLPKRSGELKQEEEVADEQVERIIKALDRSFITPFDREDIHKLATSMDDVLDNLEETSYRFQEFRIDRPTTQAVELSRIIRESCEHLEQAVRGCRNMKRPEEILRHLMEVSRLENEADRIYRDADSSLFAEPPDILTLIKWRELYSWLEATVDACKDVAQVISEIVIKGS